MRALRFALPAVILSLACGLSGDPVPDAERGEYGAFTEHHKVWEPMDLPYYGGVVEVSTETYLEVGYRSSKVGPEFLREQWSKAVKDSGWLPEEETPFEDGGYSGSFQTPRGPGSLTVYPEGSLWMVRLAILAPNAP